MHLPARDVLGQPTGCQLLGAGDNCRRRLSDLLPPGRTAASRSHDWPLSSWMPRAVGFPYRVCNICAYRAGPETPPSPFCRRDCPVCCCAVLRRTQASTSVNPIGLTAATSTSPGIASSRREACARHLTAYDFCVCVGGTHLLEWVDTSSGGSRTGRALSLRLSVIPNHHCHTFPSVFPILPILPILAIPLIIPSPLLCHRMRCPWLTG